MYICIMALMFKLKFLNAKALCALGFLFALSFSATSAQLSSTFYATTCPTLENTVRTGMRQAIQAETRMAASILRLFFHDCFVNGCDASILLVDSATFTGEQNALPNKNSARGYGVIDNIKTEVEKACPGVVSCADILAIAAREAVVQSGGPTWTLPLGRRDARTASKSTAESDLPSPFADLATLTTKFANKGLSATDMTALSGGHTLGFAQCTAFRTRIYNATANIDPTFATTRKANCPASGGDTNLAPLDGTQSRFDNRYFTDLVNKRGLLNSDQELFNGGSQDALVRRYSASPLTFFKDFTTAMINMANISPLTGTNGEIRKNCAVVN